MISRPYDMNASADDLRRADAWWRNLSNNQMNGFASKHFPNFPGVRSGVHNLMIHQMWEEEGKPEPQELIPVEPYVNPNKVSINGVMY